MVTNYCLGMVLNTSLTHVLLIGKNGGPFPRKLNGLGGHIEEGEHPKAAMLRELLEEGYGMFEHNAPMACVPLCCISYPSEVNLYVYGIRVAAQKYQLEATSVHEEGILNWYTLDMNFLSDIWSNNLAGDGNLPYFLKITVEALKEVRTSGENT